MFPRLGAFEVYYKHKIIYSKLKTGVWPKVEILGPKVVKVINNITEGRRSTEGVKLRNFSEDGDEVKS